MGKIKRLGICAAATIIYLAIGCLLGLGVMAIMPGCAAITPITSGVSVCDSVPDGETSAICALADKMGITPEEISEGIKVANLVGLSKPYYTAVEAKDFLELIRKNIKAAKKSGATVTLDQVFEYAGAKWKLLTPQTQGIINILNPVNLKAYGVKLNMSDYDFDLLLIGIDEQMEVVEPFL